VALAGVTQLAEQCSVRDCDTENGHGRECEQGCGQRREIRLSTASISSGR
jgi:hypothetical protein